ncbi:MAG TPA: quinolinate synthase NadA [Chloroflexota bacterium]|nr:quinolinate synthase NadA [Chloroflexota bacterium]
MTAETSSTSTTIASDPVSTFTSLAALGTVSPRSYGPGASASVTPPRNAAMGRQEPLPPEYRLLSPDELDMRIRAARTELGSRLVILGHHYQRDEIVRFADFRGDSFKLSQLAAARTDADFIVFCGVHFMAESADLLSAPQQQVILPNLAAGCSMADMANLEDVESCWEQLAAVTSGRIIPVTYMNSSADLKAFCGERGGIVCTSSNAPALVRWALERGDRVLFFPDEHLGRNTGYRLGIERMAVWNPRLELGGNEVEDLERSTMVLWKGFCSVHERFTVEQIAEARSRFPGVNVIVHPECRREVVAAADLDGSTEVIIRAIESAPAGTTWAVGTEINLVRRLQAEHPDKTIFCLDPVVCPCSTMYRIHPAYLCWALENLVAGRVVNRITVDDRTRHWARLALQRMLDVGA